MVGDARVVYHHVERSPVGNNTVDECLHLIALADVGHSSGDVTGRRELLDGRFDPCGVDVAGPDLGTLFQEPQGDSFAGLPSETGMPKRLKSCLP